MYSTDYRLVAFGGLFCHPRPLPSASDRPFPRHPEALRPVHPVMYAGFYRPVAFILQDSPYFYLLYVLPEPPSGDPKGLCKPRGPRSSHNLGHGPRFWPPCRLRNGAAAPAQARLLPAPSHAPRGPLSAADARLARCAATLVARPRRSVRLGRCVKALRPARCRQPMPPSRPAGALEPPHSVHRASPCPLARPAAPPSPPLPATTPLPALGRRFFAPPTAPGREGRARAHAAARPHPKARVERAHYETGIHPSARISRRHPLHAVPRSLSAYELECEHAGVRGPDPVAGLPRPKRGGCILRIRLCKRRAARDGAPDTWVAAHRAGSGSRKGTTIGPRPGGSARGTAAGPWGLQNLRTLLGGLFRPAPAARRLAVVAAGLNHGGVGVAKVLQDGATAALARLGVAD